MAEQAQYTPSTSRPVVGEPDPGGKHLREIGHLAVWSVSTAKAGNGVDCLRDGRKDTFWQSDGVQPHCVNIQFQQKVDIMEVHLHLDFKADESYTPKSVSIRAGTAIHDLKEIKIIDLEEPNGCIKIPLTTPVDGAIAAAPLRPVDPAAAHDPTRNAPLRAFFLQVAVLCNHQNGRDTHVRLVRVYGPRVEPLPGAALSLPCSICTTEWAAYATVR